MIETFDFKQNRDLADAFEAAGGVVLDSNSGQQAKPEPTLGDVGIMNRRDARRAKLYGPKRGQRGSMAIPGKRR